MRNYPRNSPQAAARIVALTLLADGHVSAVELDVLERMQVHRELGLRPTELHGVLQAFCEDLLAAAHLNWADACRIDPRTLDELMSDIDDPALRMKVLRLCIAVAEADGHLADGESIVLVAAVEQWGLHRKMLDADAGARLTAH